MYYLNGGRSGIVLIDILEDATDLALVADAADALDLAVLAWLSRPENHKDKLLLLDSDIFHISINYMVK